MVLARSSFFWAVSPPGYGGYPPPPLQMKVRRRWMGQPWKPDWKWISVLCWNWNFRTINGDQEPSRNRVVLPARQSTQAGGIESLESIPGLHKSLHIRALEFLNNLWGIRTKQDYGCRTCPPGYIGWRNRILGIDSQAPKKFKIRALNTSEREKVMFLWLQ